MLRRVAALFLCLLPAPLLAQTGTITVTASGSTIATLPSPTYVILTASNLKDESGQLPLNGELCIAPVNNSTQPESFSVQGGLGQGTQQPSCAYVVGGAITTNVATGGSPFTLVNSNYTFPLNLCYNLTATQSSDGSTTLGGGTSSYNSGYNCVQMNSTWCSTASGVMTCNLDLYPVNTAALALSGAPNISGVNVTTLSSGASATGSVSGTPPNFTFNFGIPAGPQGPAGPAGATGPQGPSGTGVAGLTGDGLGDATLTGNLAAHTVTQATIAPNALIDYGDSITVGTAATATRYIWHYLLASYLGIPTAHTVYGYHGDQACDTAGRFMLPNDNMSYVGGQTLRTIMLGTNDVLYGTTTYVANDFTPCHQALISYAGVPLTNKVMGSASTMTGSCAADTTYTANQGAVCTSSGSTLTFSLTTTGGPIYIWYRTIDGNAGTWTYKVDGGSAVAATTALTTPVCTYNMGCNGGTANNSDQSMALIRVSPEGAGSHTVTFTQTASGTMGIIAVGTPSSLPATELPPVVVGNTPHATCGTSHDSVLAAVQAAEAADISLFQGDGLNVIPAVVSNYYQAAYSSGGGYTDASSDCVHPTNLGETEIFQAFKSALRTAEAQIPPATNKSWLQVCSTCALGPNYTVQPGDQVIEVQNGGTISLPSPGANASTFNQEVRIENLDFSATSTITSYASVQTWVSQLPPQCSATFYYTGVGPNWVSSAYSCASQVAGVKQYSSGTGTVSTAYSFYDVAGGGTLTLPSTWPYSSMTVGVFNYDSSLTETIACAGSCAHNTLTSLPPGQGATYQFISSAGGWVPVGTAPMAVASGIPTVTGPSSTVSGAITLAGNVTQAGNVFTFPTTSLFNGVVEMSLPTQANTWSSGVYSPATSATTGQVSVSSSGPFMLLSTSATSAANAAGWNAGNLYFGSGLPVVKWGATYNASADYASGTSARIWMGQFGSGCSVATALASDTPTCYLAAIRFDPAVDTYYQLVTCNNSTCTATAIGTTAPSTTFTTFSIQWGSSSITGCVGTTCVTNTATLPNAAQVYRNMFEDLMATTTTAVHLELSSVFGYYTSGRAN